MNQVTPVPGEAIPASKQCADCRKTLPLADFYWVSKSAGTLRGQCKLCMKSAKAAQRDPNWVPSCSRCKTQMSARTGSGRRLCPECFAQSYDATNRRANGAHRIRLKPCTLCGGIKERFERGKFCSGCKPWESYAKSLRRFGLTPSEYMAILEAQGGGCYVCGQPPGATRLCIDHDHAIPEGRAAVRGLLCGECNYNRLPRFADDAAMLIRAARYLTEPPARSVINPTERFALAVA